MESFRLVRTFYHYLTEIGSLYKTYGSLERVGPPLIITVNLNKNYLTNINTNQSKRENALLRSRISLPMESEVVLILYTSSLSDIKCV